MKIIDEYLEKIQEFGYAHPLQTRPKPEGGISKEKPKPQPSGTKGPSGMQVDLRTKKEPLL